jgi:hypothetical protein
MILALETGMFCIAPPLVAVPVGNLKLRNQRDGLGLASDWQAVSGLAGTILVVVRAVLVYGAFSLQRM